MFTGIITGVGRIVEVNDLGRSLQHGKRLRIEAPAGYLHDVALGDSIALNGACMTVVSFDDTHFCIDISAESLRLTSGLDRPGRVNLEKALRAQDRLGGHIVSGHVDGLGQVVSFGPMGESCLLRILAPRALGRFLAYKGSITVNGVSLTVVDSERASFSVAIIPFTYEHTNFQTIDVGNHVNLEFDIIGKYVARFVTFAS